MLSHNQLIKYLRVSKGLTFKSAHSKKLRSLGFYHFYKGYRFIKNPSRMIKFTSFDEILALHQFDMGLKALLYSPVMNIECALKSHVLEAVLHFARSEKIHIVMEKTLTHYKSFECNSKQYKEYYLRNLALKQKIDSALHYQYSTGNRIVSHYLGADQDLPIWALFETMSLGEFGNFYSCLDTNVKQKTSSLLDFPIKYDPAGELTKQIIFIIKDLRNAIAHNKVIFDTRFQNSKINKGFAGFLIDETGIQNVDFAGIESYVILIVYLLRRLRFSKTECKSIVRSYESLLETLRAQLPICIYNQIVGTSIRADMRKLNAYITCS